MGIEY